MTELVANSLDDVTIASEGRTVVLFTQPATCVPCRQFKPHWERSVATAEDVNFIYVDLDTVEDAAVEYGVMRVPTVKLYENGEYVRDVRAPQGALPFLKDIGE